MFAHTIDYVFGDYINQESSEKEINDILKADSEILSYLETDNITLEELENLDNYPILENKSPQLCTDRLDGVLHTCYIWLHTHSIDQVKEIYDNIIVLNNEYGKQEIGFRNQEIADKFVPMVFTYAKELQGNTDKYVMKYISELVKLASQSDIISLDDLYTMKEQEVIQIFKNNFSSWEKFENADSSTLVKTDEMSSNFYISFDTKKRNTIPLVRTLDGNKRVVDISNDFKRIYSNFENYSDSKFAYIKSIKNCR